MFADISQQFYALIVQILVKPMKVQQVVIDGRWIAAEFLQPVQKVLGRCADFSR